MMGEKRFYITDTGLGLDNESDEMYSFGDEEDFCRLFDKLNEQQASITKLNDEKEYWKNKAMILLMQVRRLTSRMTDEEVKEFSKELEE